ncbi:MAG TPA: polysaccharide biosynthesis/export family protein [Lacunisphaera sp.]|nr:polysaccharide biosynthesis/export family protein [Lacunisphaera sp.]
MRTTTRPCEMTNETALPIRTRIWREGFMAVSAVAAGLAVFLQTGCAGAPSPTPAVAAATPPAAPAPSEETMNLKAGDILKVGFPGVPTMDVTQPVRADGKISLPMAGDVVAAGKSTEELNKELLEIYSTKLVSKEVTVSLMASPYPVYVTGAVLRPGKIVAERRITVFDAIMEAGGFDKAKAKLGAVKVVRQENGQSQSFTVDLQKMLSGEPSAPFYLKPYDTVYVPEKFNWF